MSPVSFSTITPGNFQLSPCRVTFKGVDIGATLGNVVVKTEDMLSDLKSDQLGQTVIDRRNSGFKCSIETEFAEVTLKSNWKVLFPAHKYVTQGGATLISFDSQVGASQISFAGLLTLHPLSLPDSDKSQDFNVYLATAEGKADYTHSPTEQTKMKCVWDVYPDTSTLPPRFYSFGDPATGLINASFLPAVAATGNIGNGTVGSIAVFNGGTKTETISLKCVTAGTGAVFFVSGGSSGALGLATNGLAFNSAVIALTITGGGTPFAVNDSFTIATTAANYG